MTAPHLPNVPSAGQRTGPSRVRVGALGPRLLLRGVLIGLALLLLVVLMAGCGNAELPASPPTSPQATSPAAPPPSPTGTTTSPTTESAPSTTRPPGTPSSPQGPTPGDPTGTGGGPAGAGASAAQPARPIWPVTDAASARELQQQTDRGSQPWLLDPEEVAVSYAGVELGYRNPEVVVLAPGRVDLQDGRSPAQAVVTMQQTVRTGPGGIWLVTRVDPH